MIAVTLDETTVKSFNRTEGRTRIRDFIGAAGEITDGACAFMVELPEPGGLVSPHFHDVDQYQVAVGGGGSLGKQPLHPVSFQYADAYTPYGPIIAGENGLSYFTLRIASAGGHYDMPANRHLMKGTQRRSFTGRFEPSSKALETEKSVREVLAEPQPDGMQVIGVRLGAHARESGMPSDGGGQFWLVTAGSIMRDGRSLPRLSVVHMAAGEAVPDVEAGADGAEVIVLQFPRPSDRPGSDPDKLIRPKQYVATASKIPD